MQKPSQHVWSLVERIIGFPPGPSPHVPPTITALAAAASRPDWANLDDVDVPIYQRSLSVAINEAISTTFPLPLSRALAHSSTCCGLVECGPPRSTWPSHP